MAIPATVVVVQWFGVAASRLGVHMFLVHGELAVWRRGLSRVGNVRVVKLSSAKLQVRQFLAKWYVRDLQESLAVFPEEVATIDGFPGDLDGEVE